MNLSDKGELVGFLRKHGLSAEKSLGQHFLCSQEVVKQIVTACGDFRGCLEIGPGPGILTSFLDRKAEKMIAIEFDPRMVRLLADSAPGCQVIVEDALRADLPALIQELPSPVALVSNMPYYITGPLLDRVTRCRHFIQSAILMMQKEVGQKLIAEPGNRERGSLTVNMQSYFEIEWVVNAPSDCFLPPPKVDSIVLKLIPRSEIFSTTFYKVVKAGFSQNRKTLSNNLAATFRMSKSDVNLKLKQCDLNEQSRAFELEELKWIELTAQFESLLNESTNL